MGKNPSDVGEINAEIMKKIVVFTGAGVSEESGLKTFRDEGGLWMGYNVYEVATPEGWLADRKNVQNFYNMRRQDVLAAKPNTAHLAIAALQEKYDVHVVTQNIDDLHERAGSKKVTHLHGEILKMRSDKSEQPTWDIREDIPHAALAEDGGYLRPHVVWFGEPVPEIEAAARIMSTADIFIVVGTSLQVYPAAGLIYSLPPGIPKILVDPNPPATAGSMGFRVIAKKGGAGMLEVLKELGVDFDRAT